MKMLFLGYTPYQWEVIQRKYPPTKGSVPDAPDRGLDWEARLITGYPNTRKALKARFQWLKDHHKDPNEAELYFK